MPKSEIEPKNSVVSRTAVSYLCEEVPPFLPRFALGVSAFARNSVWRQRKRRKRSRVSSWLSDGRRGRPEPACLTRCEGHTLARRSWTAGGAGAKGIAAGCTSSHSPGEILFTGPALGPGRMCRSNLSADEVKAVRVLQLGRAKSAFDAVLCSAALDACGPLAWPRRLHTIIYGMRRFACLRRPEERVLHGEISSTC